MKRLLGDPPKVTQPLQQQPYPNGRAPSLAKRISVSSSSSAGVGDRERMCCVMEFIASVMLISFLAEVAIHSTNPCSLQNAFWNAIVMEKRCCQRKSGTMRRATTHHDVFIEGYVDQVTFICHENHRNRITVRQPHLGINVALPFVHSLERGRAREIKDHHACYGVLVVYSGQIPVSFCPHR